MEAQIVGKGVDLKKGKDTYFQTSVGTWGYNERVPVAERKKMFLLPYSREKREGGEGQKVRIHLGDPLSRERR